MCPLGWPAGDIMIRSTRLIQIARTARCDEALVVDVLDVSRQAV